MIAIFPLSRPSRVILVVLDLSNDVCSVYYLFLSYLGVVACLIPGTLAGISITVKLSAVHRLVLNSGRPIIVWVISLALKWQDFNSLQLVGFIIMTVGVIIFNDILSIGNKKSYSEISIKLSLANRWVSVVEFNDWALGIGKFFGQESTVVKWNHQILNLHLVTVCQKVPILDFQSEFSMSKIIRIFLKKIHWRISI